MMEKRFLTWVLVGGVVCLLGLMTPVKAQDHPQKPGLAELNSYELLERDLGQFLVLVQEHDEKTHRHGWSVPLIRSVFQSIFLSSGLSHFNGSSASVPPTLKAYQTP